MSSIWISAQECSQDELFHLTELIRKDTDLQIILSCNPPQLGERRASADAKAADLLVRIGMRPNLKGYQFLRTALKLCLKDKEELDGITKRLYPSVAKKHATTAGKVEHDIRHAIEVCWAKGNEREQRMVFGYGFGEGKRPTNSEFIMRMTEHLEKMNRPLYS